jgi:hypothetical protein
MAEVYTRQSITNQQLYVEGYTDTMPKNYSEELNEEGIENLIVFLLISRNNPTEHLSSIRIDFPASN